MDDFTEEDFFDMMGNEVRRKIVEALARGPLNMKALVDLMDVSRQAILKQINALEEKGLIFHQKDDSTEGQKGPSPHIYQLSRFFSFTYEMNPSYMKPRIIRLDLLPGETPDEAGENDVKMEPIQFDSCFKDLVELDKELVSLQQKHQEIFREKNEVIRKALRKIEASLQDQDDREVLYYFLKFPRKAIEGVTLDEIARILGIRNIYAEAAMNNLEKLEVVEKIKDKSGTRYVLKGLG
ncbi:MAG: helix-turn-helix domain-containing protein [Candidatus Hodarchaeota archaeon]